VEWLVVLLLALAAAALIALPRTRGRTTIEPDRLHAEHALLVAELRELDDDLDAGRISLEDRQAGRSSLGPRLRAVTEALRAAGEDIRPANEAPRGAAHKRDTA